MRTDVPESFRNAILEGIEKGERKVKLRNKLKLAGAAAAVLCVIITVTALGLEPMPDTVQPSQDSTTVLAQPDDSARVTVYATEGGKYYHLVSGCCGMTGAAAMDPAEAGEKGKQACPVCARAEASDGLSDSVNDTEVYVYATQNGRFYHAIPDCSGMKNAEQVTPANAVARGKTACPNCGAQDCVNVYSDEVCARLAAYTPGAMDCLADTFGSENLSTDKYPNIDGTAGKVWAAGESSCIVDMYWETGMVEITFHTDMRQNYSENLLSSIQDRRTAVWYDNAVSAVNRYLGYTAEAGKPGMSTVVMVFTAEGEMTSLQFLWETRNQLALVETDPSSGAIITFSISRLG